MYIKFVERKSNQELLLLHFVQYKVINCNQILYRRTVKTNNGFHRQKISGIPVNCLQNKGRTGFVPNDAKYTGSSHILGSSRYVFAVDQHDKRHTRHYTSPNLLIYMIYSSMFKFIVGYYVCDRNGTFFISRRTLVGN